MTRVDGAQTRKLYLSTDTSNPNLDPDEVLGYVVDYSEHVTPLIGVAKPSNFTFKENGFGFNPDTDTVISKGKLSGGQSAYNAIFGLGYFGPTFYTKIVLDAPIATGQFSKGKYIFGVNSGAYGVIEGATGSAFTTGNELMVTTLSGKFQPGEVIREEADAQGGTNSARIATNNTISHFIVKFRSQGYAQRSGITINGVAFDTSKVDVELNIDGKVIYIDIKNRNAFTQTYSEPPNVLVDVGSANVTATAKIEAVLFRDTVTTYTPEDVKSFGCAFGSGGAIIYC